MTSFLSLRPYRSDDLDAVIAVFLGSVRKVAAKDYSPAQIEAWAQADPDKWSVRLLARMAWVVSAEQQVVGFAELEADGHLDTLFVHPAYQGRGVATALLDIVEAAARGQGVLRLFTEASITAYPFFERRGFQLLKPQMVEVRGQILRNFRMEKSLVWKSGSFGKNTLY